MKRKITSRLSISMIALIILLFFCVNTYAVNKNTTSSAIKINEQLINAEETWRRFDDVNENITYDGNFAYYDGNGEYGGGVHYTNRTNDSIKFNFYGTKIRIIESMNIDRDSKIEIRIDNKSYTYTTYNSAINYQCLVFELADLELKEHFVVIKKLGQDDSVFALDAIDIDKNGELRKYNPEVLTPQNNRAILKVNLVSGIEKEYDLSMELVNEFQEWLKNKDDRTEFFTINKNTNIKPFNSRKDYLMRDKIVMFEINEYTVE